MTTVRLPIEIEQKLTSFSELQNKSKTEIIKEALEVFFYQQNFDKDSYELGLDYFGKFGSGDGTLSKTYKNKLKDKIRAKYKGFYLNKPEKSNLYQKKPVQKEPVSLIFCS